MVDLLTSTLVAAKTRQGPTRRTMGLDGPRRGCTARSGWAGYGFPGRPAVGRPTSEAWIDPWVSHLSSLGRRVPDRDRHRTDLRQRPGSPAARALDAAGAGEPRSRRTGYVPRRPGIERAVPMLGPQLLAADPRLARLEEPHHVVDETG